MARMASKMRRLDRLEARINSGDKPITVIHQSLDDSDRYYWVGDPEKKLMTEQEALDRFEADYRIIWVTYRKDWRDREVRSYR